MDFNFKTTRGIEQYFSESSIGLELQCMDYAMNFDESYSYYFVTPIEYFMGIFKHFHGDDAYVGDMLNHKQERRAMKACARFERAFKEWEHIHQDFRKKFTSFLENASNEEIQLYLDIHGPDYNVAMTMGSYIREWYNVLWYPEREIYFKYARLFWQKYPEYFFELFRKNDLIANLFIDDTLRYRKLKTFVTDALAYKPDYFVKWKDDFGNNILHYFLIGASVKRFRALGHEFVESRYRIPKHYEYKNFVLEHNFCPTDNFGEDAEEIFDLIIRSGVNPDEKNMIGLSYKDLRKYSFVYYYDTGIEFQRKGEKLVEMDRISEMRAQDSLEDSMIAHAERRSVRQNNEMKNEHYRSYRHHSRH